MQKLQRDFYLESALVLAPKFLGKYLVYNSPKGLVSGRIIDVEAYPAKVDEVSHGNRRTKRTEVMYREGGYAYIYLVYGIHHQFAAVVNRKNIPEVVFIRGVIPCDGIEVMKSNFGRCVKEDLELTKSPGNLCRSFGISSDLYGEDLTCDIMYIEDRGENVSPKSVIADTRVGISSKLKGSKNKFRFYFDPK